MSVLNYRDSIITKKRKGDSLDPFIDISEALQIDGTVVKLTEIPSELHKVKVSGANVQWVEKEKGLPSENQYVVDYIDGIVTFHHSRHALQLQFSYKGTGSRFVPSSMIYTKQSDGRIEETLHDIVEAGRASIDNLKNLNDSIIRAENAIVNADSKANLAQQKVDELSGLGTTLNQKITESQSATTNANNSATNAITQATHAKNQGDYAKEQADLAKQLIQDVGQAAGVTSINGKSGALTLTATDVNAIPVSEKGVANGIAKLNAQGKVVDASGTPVEGAVSSVNGKTGAVNITSVDNADKLGNNLPSHYATAKSVTDIDNKIGVLTELKTSAKDKLVSAVNEVKSDSHTHTNKLVLDKLSEDVNGKPLYNGQSIGGSSDTSNYLNDEVTVFVSNSGVDSNSGLSSDKPVKTLAKAVELIRNLGAKKRTITLTGGQTFNESLTLSGIHGGTLEINGNYDNNAFIKELSIDQCTAIIRIYHTKINGGTYYPVRIDRCTKVDLYMVEVTGGQSGCKISLSNAYLSSVTFNNIIGRIIEADYSSYVFVENIKGSNPSQYADIYYANASIIIGNKGTITAGGREQSSSAGGQVLFGNSPNSMSQNIPTRSGWTTSTEGLIAVRIGDTVYIEGGLNRNSATDKIAAIVPVGFRPKAFVPFYARTFYSSTTQFTRMLLNSDGEIEILDTLSNITYPLAFNFSFYSKN